MDIYRALLGGRGGLVAIEEIKRILAEAVRSDPCVAADINGDVPRPLRVQFVVDTFLAVLTWSISRHPAIDPAVMNAAFRQLVLRGLRRGRSGPAGAHQRSAADSSPV